MPFSGSQSKNRQTIGKVSLPSSTLRESDTATITSSSSSRCDRSITRREPAAPGLSLPDSSSLSDSSLLKISMTCYGSIPNWSASQLAALVSGGGFAEASRMGMLLLGGEVAKPASQIDPLLLGEGVAKPASGAAMLISSGESTGSASPRGLY
jgi:hypothetical protein